MQGLHPPASLQLLNFGVAAAVNAFNLGLVSLEGIGIWNASGCQPGPSHVGAGEAAVVMLRGQRELQTSQQDFSEFLGAVMAARVMEVGTHSAWARDAVAGCGHEVPG